MSKLVRLLMVATMLLGFVSITPATTMTSAAPQAPDAPITVTILHTNDFHARVDEYNRNGARCSEADQTDGMCIGGYPRLHTMVEAIRAEEENVLLLDAGDQFQGTLFYNLFKADVITDTMNAMGYDAMTIGNHEFDNGPAELARLIDGAAFPIVSANLDVTAEPALAGKIAPSTIITRSGERFGIVGITTPETENISSPGDNVVFNNPVASLQAAVDALEAQGVDKIIALTHIGYAEDLELAAAVSGVDVIIGGHSHDFIYTPTMPITFTPPQYPQYSPLNPAGPYPTVVNSKDSEPVLVVTAFQWGTFLGRLDVSFDGAGLVTQYDGNPIYVSNEITKSATMETILDKYRPAIETLVATNVGTTTVDLPILEGSVQICRMGECLMGNLVADAMLWKANQVDPDADYQIAFQNGGGLRAPIMAGAVTMGDVLETLPFGNAIATFELTGTHVIAALENGASKYPKTNGGFAQVSGLHYRIEPAKPAGSRVSHVEVLSGTTYVPLDPNAVYKVVTNDFMRKGGDNYTMFRDYAIDPYDFGPALDEALAEYFSTYSPITPQLEGRVQFPPTNLSTSTKTVADAGGDNEASAGEILSYTITIANTGELGAAFRLTDTLPAGVTYVTDTLTSGGFPTGSVVTITAGVLTAHTANFPDAPEDGTLLGVPATIRFNVRVSDPAPAGTEIVNAIELQDLYAVYNIAPATIPLVQVGGNTIFLPLVVRNFGQ